MNNDTIENKRAMFLDMQEHPERYTDEQISGLLADDDVRVFAQTLGAAKRAMMLHEHEQVDVDYAWERFAQAHPTPQRSRLKYAAVTVGIVFLTGMAWAAAVQWGIIGNNKPTTNAPQKPLAERAIPADTLLADTMKTPKDSVDMTPVTFDNAPLSTILTEMGAFYHVGVNFKSESTKQIRLYFQWDKHLPLAQQIELLNSFDRINIILQDNHLDID
jgi:hypothetical protein